MNILDLWLDGLQMQNLLMLRACCVIKHTLVGCGPLQLNPAELWESHPECVLESCHRGISHSSPSCCGWGLCPGNSFHTPALFRALLVGGARSCNHKMNPEAKSQVLAVSYPRCGSRTPKGLDWALVHLWQQSLAFRVGCLGLNRSFAASLLSD